MDKFDKNRDGVFSAQDDLEFVLTDYDTHLEVTERALHRLDEYLWKQLFPRNGELSIAPGDLEYVNSYVHVVSELRKVYRERINQCFEQYGRIKDHFADIALFPDEHNDLKEP